MNLSELVERYANDPSEYGRARYALAWIARECGEQNYRMAMEGNALHAAGTIRMCREAAERVLLLLEP